MSGLFYFYFKCYLCQSIKYFYILFVFLIVLCYNFLRKHFTFREVILWVFVGDIFLIYILNMVLILIRSCSDGLCAKP